MDVAERIAQLPGGADLAAMLRSVSGSPGTIRGIATRWRTAATTASDQTGRVKTAVQNVDTAWQGRSAEKFTEYMGAYNRAGTDLHDALTSCANALDRAAGQLETSKSRIREICDSLLSTAAGLESEYRDNENRTQYTNAVSSEVAKETARAQPFKEAAADAVEQAMNDIKTHLGARRTTFASIKAPGDQPFVPGPGQTVHWDPAPLTTTLQSGGGSGNGTGHPGNVSPVAYAGDGPPPQPLPFSPGTATGDRIVAAARLHLGKPYVWGANGPGAFDCSGLVYYVLNQAGVKIGDTTAAGYQASGKPVSSPQPGDIVFFGHPAGHVGVYIGNGQMIHAPRPGSEVMVASVAGDGRPVSYRRFT